MKNGLLEKSIRFLMLPGRLFPKLLEPLFMHWLIKVINLRDQLTALEFMKVRFAELQTIKAIRVSSVGNLVAREMYGQLILALEESSVPDLRLASMERVAIFRTIVFHVVSAVKLRRTIEEMRRWSY